MSAIVGNLVSILLSPLLLIRRLVWLFLTKIALTMRGRRMLLSISLYAQLKQIDASSLDEETLESLTEDINELFGLVKRNNDALIIPIMVHKYIWRRVDLPDPEQLKSQPIRKSCHQILRGVPRWLRYNEKVMSDDVGILVRKCIGRNVIQ